MAQTGAHAGVLTGTRRLSDNEYPLVCEHTKGDALCETYAVHCRARCALWPDEQAVQEKGEERFNSALLDILHPAIQHGNVIHVYIASIESQCLPAEAFGGMSVAAFASRWSYCQGDKGNITYRRIARQGGRFPLPMGENDSQGVASPHLTELESRSNAGCSMQCLACGW
jgi:hypothetical protein